MAGYTMQFVAELKDYKPRIWRRFQISSNADLEDFCYVLMKMFRMEGYHLFEFKIKGGRYTLPLPDDVDVWDEPAKKLRGAAIRKLFTKEGDSGELWYDFGDCWYVNVKLEVLKVAEIISADELPRVIKGKGFGIVEDCGGIWGLEEIAEGLKTGKGEDWENRKSWLEDICPEVLEKGMDFFDIDKINTLFKGAM
ncbi:MAG: plasmid pRiA4b ORF-3 family protein [Nitrososphaerota archaeon]|jgi:hypothetical protein|nr:plasmid pRiA4b ORF-3 family protein [Nitrososphaerota archaeon]